MKKLITLLFSAVLLLSMPVMAAEVDQSRIVNIDASKSIIALGADLSAEQRATVLSLMDVTEADLANYQVVTITNDMEHQYLDAYMDASVIGSKSLSSVKITPAESGHGVLVTTKNINYCTTGMYRNALLTAGVSDADILVVGPTEISGTAALIGAIKGYEAMSGESVSDTTLDTAMNELITTGEIAMQDADSQDIEELIAFVKAKVAAGGLDSDDQIRSAIEEGEDKFGVTLTEDEINQIIAIMQKINQLGLDPNVLVSQAEDLYSKFGKDFLKNLDTDAIAKEVAKSAASGFFAKIGDAIKGFFAGLFQ
ncbi:MAG: DUF1002 domain-containing protein [Lachnospiraceae bacterium]|jgi:predicted secreted protein|nr:DUF1002 domain-containing protein [Bacillota bacterium]MDY3770155.1 DUF1002 domain-containing protein [Lachnospiraceae bacterium]MEE1438791.1 DUF1002 domain-containing protein [Lachnospiraceae bacterium]CCZ28341.1 predicted secreted protein [Firmicutes bacterium CAG:194]